MRERERFGIGLYVHVKLGWNPNKDETEINQHIDIIPASVAKNIHSLVSNRTSV